MSYSRIKTPLGSVLQQAGLVSKEQLEQALEQQKDGKDLGIGEILANQGQIKPQTVDFFANRWSRLVKEEKQLLGQYLKQAALLSENQVQTILIEQRQSKLKFGELAIAKGWIKPKTVKFFLSHLASKSKPEISVDNRGDSQAYSQKVHSDFLQIKLRLLNLDTKGVYSEQALERSLVWTGGQSLLTKKLFQFLAESEQGMLSGREIEQIDHLVKSKILNYREDQDLTNHFQGISKRIVHNQNCEPQKLLQLYQQILNEAVKPDGSLEQQELLKSGLVIEQQGQLTIANPIYRAIFNPDWILKKAVNLDQPSSSAIAVIPEAPLAISAPIQENRRYGLLKPRNILLCLAVIALLSVLLNNMAKRWAVRSAFAQGNALLQQKSFDQAVGKYNTLLNIDSNYFQAWTNRGYALAGLEKYHEMRESCSTATIIEPKAVYAWNCLGEALHNLQREPEAIAAFDQAISLNQNDAIFLINKGESLKALGREEQSLKATQSAIKILEQIEATKGKNQVRGEFAVALTFLGNGYRKKRQYETAVDAYHRALKYSPDYFPAQIGKGIVLGKIKRYQEAQQEFRAILINPQLTKSRQSQVWFYLGKTLCESQQSREGIEAFEKALQIKPDYKAARVAKQQCS